MTLLECGDRSRRFGPAMSEKRRLRSPHSKAAFLLVLALFACSPRVMTRERWVKAPPAERLLYVKALLGAEAAKKAKGGNARTFSKLPNDYVEAIDRAYATGDTRPADRIFQSLSDPPR